MMKKTTVLLTVFTGLLLTTLTACGETKYDDVLRVYNWEDYIATGEDEDGEKIDTSVIEDFQKAYQAETGRTIKVEYNTFSTNEEMYTQLDTGRAKYDLICPSDYMIQKMIANDKLETFAVEDDKSYTHLTNYNQYASPYIQGLFKEKNWTQYAVPYMWGTMGFTYDPEAVNRNDVDTWDVLWNTAYKGKITIKDSVRDTYFTGVMHVYKEECDALALQYAKGTLTAEAYTAALTEIFNRCDDTTLAKVAQAFSTLKNNIFGFEVDDGKNDIVTGSIKINLAWSGDAVYSLDNADVSKKTLEYVVPKEGSNIWFDGWVMPKGANKDLAQIFLDYISLPKVAAKNMDFIGYTSAIAGQEIWELVNDWYGEEEGDSIDLSYFFDGTLADKNKKAILLSSSRRRQLDAQYPDFETVTRCAIMNDFGSQTEKVYEMWTNFKSR